MGFMHQSNEWSKHVAFGVGLGLGIGIISWKLYKERERERDQLSAAVERLADEVKNLKDVLALLKKASKDGGAVEKKSKESYLEESENDDDDEFFESPQSPMQDIVLVNEDSKKADQPSEALEDLNERLEKVDNLRNGSEEDKEEHYNILLKLSKEFPSSCEVLWRLGRAQYDMAMTRGRTGDLEQKQNFMKQGMESGRKALDVDDNSSQAHKWYGILIGNYSEFCATQEKIKLGHEYREHILKAIELDPSDPASYSLLARWCYEVYMLPWYMRKAAAAIFGNPPTSTAEEALNYAMKAEELKPDFWKENTLLIAKCYYQMSNYPKTKEWLMKASDLPTTSEDDKLAQKEIEELLRKV